jgi:hypothetical protein
MKRCPKCNRTFDNSLNFCLEDGTRLASLLAGSAPVTVEAKAIQTASPTVAFPIAPVRSAANDLSQAVEVETVAAKKGIVGTNAVSRINPAFEYAAIVIALAHNWWQWLYLEKQYVSSIFDYIFSANFLMWLLLLVGGTAVGLFVVRKSEKKIFGILSLVILAINLILFLVPRR